MSLLKFDNDTEVHRSGTGPGERCPACIDGYPQPHEGCEGRVHAELRYDMEAGYTSTSRHEACSGCKHSRIEELKVLPEMDIAPRRGDPT